MAMLRAGRWHRRSRRRARIEMVPLIDCMFLLLAFFIYIATATVLQRGIPVDLAHAASGEQLSKEVKPIQIFLRKSGELFLENRLIPEAELAQELKILAGVAPETVPGKTRLVVLNADKGVLHERVVEILDLARGSGVKELVLAVEPPENHSR